MDIVLLNKWKELLLENFDKRGGSDSYYFKYIYGIIFGILEPNVHLTMKIQLTLLALLLPILFFGQSSDVESAYLFKHYQIDIETGHSFSFPTSTNPNGSVFTNLNLVNSYRFNDRWSAGLGLGANLGSSSVEGSVFLDLTHTFSTTKIAPFVSLRPGYITSLYVRGVHYAADFGLKLKFKKQLTNTFRIGYDYQPVSTRGRDDVFYPDSHFHHLRLIYGISF